MHLPMLSDEELVRFASSEVNDLTSTPLELELLRRFEARLPELEANEQVHAKLENHGVTSGELATLLDALILNVVNSVELLKAVGDAGVDSATALKAEFAVAAKFRALAEDAGDVFERLSHLASGEGSPTTHA